MLKLVVDPLDPQTVYVLTGNGRFACGPAVVYRSTNGAGSWSQMASELGEVLDVGLAPGDPDHIYIATMHSGCDEPYYWIDVEGSLHVSVDGGNHFEEVVAQTGVIWPKGESTMRLIDPREPFPWNLPKGMYILKLKTDGAKYVRKIIKQ